MKLDLFEFARTAADAAGELPVAALARIETIDREGVLRWTAHGSTRGRDANMHLDVTVDGSIGLVCQRCLQPMKQAVALASHFLIAQDEAGAEALDDTDEYDVIAGSSDFDLDALIEDEVILALPIAPRHARCPDDAAAHALRSAAPSPFAALAEMRSNLRATPSVATRIPDPDGGEGD